jgi:hypothetical protein
LPPLKVATGGIDNISSSPMGLTDDLEAEVKKKWPELLIKGALGLALFLVAIIWRDALVDVAKRAWSATTKETLGATLGLSLLVVCALGFIALSLRGKLKKARAENQTLAPYPEKLQTASRDNERLTAENARLTGDLKQAREEAAKLQGRIDNPPRKFKFGVDWDKEDIPYCTVHKFPLSNLIRLNRHNLIPSFLCPAGEVIPLRDDQGKLISPADAKRLLHSVPVGPQGESQDIQSSDATRPNEKLEQTLALLNSFSNALPEHRVDTTEAEEYHALLETAQRELNCDLSQFRIPVSAIKSIEIPQSMSFDEWGNPASDYTPEYERFIPSSVFKRKVDALLSFLNQRQL